ncbi:hypothetical protein NEIRO02_1014 [Nematocida sp. AWRm79]|nr:hypothetical protein NEIRO02_1014 [Nematocida sp. AWRm79]
MNSKEHQLKMRIQREFSHECNGISMNIENIQDKIIRIAANTYKRDSTFNEKYPMLNNLAYNTFISLVAAHAYMVKEINEDKIIHMIDESLRVTNIIMDSVEKSTLFLPKDTQKTAFYNMLDRMYTFSNHPVSFLTYVKKDISSAINLQSYGKNDLIDESYSMNSLKELCHMNESGEYSNLERVLDIITANMGNFTTYDNNNNLQSNIQNLNLSDKDVHLLKLFSSCCITNLYNLLNVMTRSTKIKSKSINEEEIKKGFKKSHIKKTLDLPIIKEMISTGIEIINKAPHLLEKDPEMKEYSGYMAFSLKCGLEILSFWGVTSIISQIPIIKTGIEKAICKALPVSIGYSDIFDIMASFFVIDKVMNPTYDGFINSAFRLMLYAFQENEVYTSYTKEEKGIIENICYFNNIDIKEFEQNVIEKHRQIIKNQLDLIFSSPLNMTLESVLTESLKEITAIGYNNKGFKPTEKLIEMIDELEEDVDTRPIDPLNYAKGHTILVNMENIKTKSNIPINTQRSNVDVKVISVNDEDTSISNNSKKKLYKKEQAIDEVAEDALFADYPSIDSYQVEEDVIAAHETIPATVEPHASSHLIQAQETQEKESVIITPPEPQTNSYAMKIFINICDLCCMPFKSITSMGITLVLLLLLISILILFYYNRIILFA